MRLILIRHGQTPTNVLGLLDTAVPGPPLTDLGLEQAASLVTALADEKIDAIVASSQLRAQQTAAPLAGDRELPVRVLDGLREIAAGDWEMAGDRPSIRGYIGLLGRWTGGELEPASPGPTGESGRSVLQRYDQAIDTAFADGAETVVAVSHGAAIRFWAGLRAANLPDDFGVDSPVHNTGVIVLVRNGSDESWWAESWTGEAIGGARLDDAVGDGPAADPW